MVKISKNLRAWVKNAKIEQNSWQVGMFTYLIAKVFFQFCFQPQMLSIFRIVRLCWPCGYSQYYKRPIGGRMVSSRFSQCGDMRHPSSKVMFEPVNLFVPVSLRISCQSIVSWRLLPHCLQFLVFPSFRAWKKSRWVEIVWLSCEPGDTSIKTTTRLHSSIPSYFTASAWLVYWPLHGFCTKACCNAKLLHFPCRSWVLNCGR